MNVNYLQPSGVISQGPYTPAVEIVSNGLKTLYVSGQGTFDPTNGQKYLGSDIERQANLALANLERILTGCGYTLDDLIKVTVFAVCADDLAAISKSYQAKLADTKHLPARSTVIVAGLPDGMAIEIEAIAAQADTQ